MQRLTQAARFLLAATLILVFSSLFTVTASAHADVASSDPAADSTLTAAPSRVTVTYDEETSTNTAESRLEVYLGGQRVDNADAVVDADSRKQISVSLKPGLGDGSYKVNWRTFTEDDNGVESGSFNFTVNSGSSAVTTVDSSTSNPASTLPTTGNTTNYLPLLLLAGLLLMAGLAMRPKRATNN